MNATDAWQEVERPREGEAVCFDVGERMVLSTGEVIEVQGQGFVVCYLNALRAWRNHCPHAGSPLDWLPGQFFSEDKQRLVCHTHHAEFEPLSGHCVAGPCPRGLYALPLKEKDGKVFVPLSIVL